MENARIAIFEDRRFLREVFRVLLEKDRHEIVAEAGTVEKATEVIDSLQPDDIDVILLDGNFTEGFIDSHEGAELVKIIREKLGNVAIVGISAARPIEGTNINIPKDQYGAIGDFIDKL